MKRFLALAVLLAASASVAPAQQEAAKHPVENLFMSEREVVVKVDEGLAPGKK